MSKEMSSGEKKKKKFSKKQLRASQGILTQQAKTNIYASQAGMTGYGAVRHGADIRSDDAVADGQSVLTQQAATHIYASQKGMTGFGAVRHGGDIRVRELYEEGDDDEYPTDEEEEVRAPTSRRTQREEQPKEPEANADAEEEQEEAPAEED